jgi:hypothetical protein
MKSAWPAKCLTMALTAVLALASALTGLVPAAAAAAAGTHAVLATAAISMLIASLAFSFLPPLRAEIALWPGAHTTLQPRPRRSG